MAHRNSWFTELKNGWIFHGEVLVIPRWYIILFHMIPYYIYILYFALLYIATPKEDRKRIPLRLLINTDKLFFYLFGRYYILYYIIYIYICTLTSLHNVSLWGY
jgi:hypothetical protein